MFDTVTGTKHPELTLTPETAEDTHELVLGSLLAAVGQLDAPQSDADLMEILERILDSALTTVHAKDGSLLVRDDETDELVFALVRGDAASKDLLWRRLPTGKGIASWVVENAEAAVVNDTQTDKRFLWRARSGAQVRDQLHPGRADHWRRRGARRHRGFE